MIVSCVDSPTHGGGRRGLSVTGHNAPRHYVDNMPQSENHVCIFQGGFDNRESETEQRPLKTKQDLFIAVMVAGGICH